MQSKGQERVKMWDNSIARRRMTITSLNIHIRILSLLRVAVVAEIPAMGIFDIDIETDWYK